jgi:hypothetical protein
MTIDWLEQFASVAAEMNNVRELPNAKIDYDLLADAIIWSDEYPSNPTRPMYDFQCIKILLRYRTSLLLGTPDETFKVYWDRAKELFPNWAGFTFSRLVPNDDLKKFYEHHGKRGIQHLKKVLNCEESERKGGGEKRR